MKLLILFVLIAMFIFEWWISELNFTHRTQPIPANVIDVYDEGDYKKWLEYTMLNHRLSKISSALSLFVMLILLVFNGFVYLNDWVAQYTTSIPLSTLGFLGVYMLLSTILDLPFAYISKFVIDEKFGFNTSSLTTFVLDQLKGLLLTLVLGGILGYLMITLYLQLGIAFIYAGWAILVVIILIINLLYTKVFIRLFNRLTPLEDSSLKSSIESFAKEVGYEVTKISIMNASKRSTRLNAFFSGFGKFKQIVLYDTLVEKCPEDEIVAVLAHEIGHAKYKDVLRGFAQSVIMLLIYVVLLVGFLNTSIFVTAFGFSEPHIGFSVVLFGIIMSPLGLLLQLPSSYISRKAEYRADGFAKKYGYGPSLIRALKRLAKENYSNLTPHPLVVKLSYSHPPITNRIDALSK